jgi:hypothetical protein
VTATPANAPAAQDASLDEATLLRILAVIVGITGSLYAIALLADYAQFAFYAGRLSLVLFLAGSVWGFGFLILRDGHQDSAERYALELAKDQALRWDEDTTAAPDMPGLLHRYSDLVHRHREVATLRSASASLALFATAAAGVAGATVLVGIEGVWAVGNFLAIMFLVAAVLVHLVGAGHPEATGHLVRFLPGRSSATMESS